jgi:ATP-dependent helicase/nuclease subunit B
MAPTVDRAVSHPFPTIGGVTISATLVAPPDALQALAAALREAKGSDPLAAVTVAVPTNTCGVMTRRALGRAGGLVGVDMVTLNRLAELIAGPELAAAGRSPMSTPVIDLAIATVLDTEPGPFAPVASHPSTVVALRETHGELRLAGAAARHRLAEESVRGRQVLRVSDAVTAALCPAWYDEADLYLSATKAVERTVPDGLRSLVVFLPDELPVLAVEFLAALGRSIDVRLVLQVTGADAADAAALAIVDALDVEAARSCPSGSGPERQEELGVRGPVEIVSTTDADDEVRHAVRTVLDAARRGTPFERIAVLWPQHQPYARLVEHHLTACEIPWNGRPGTTVVERLAPRLVLDLLDVDRRGLRRRTLFALLADVPARDREGAYLPTARWERVSREAGIARDDDWDRRLAAIAGRDRWAEAATSLRDFVGELRDELGHPSARRPWSVWSQWCTDQVERRLGRQSIERLPEPEYRAWEALTAALDRLAHLDPVGEPVTRHRFRSTLEAELDASPARQGRVGSGVTVGPLAGATGIDVDVVVVLGAAEGLLPPTPTSDPLLSEADRVRVGLPGADARAHRLHRLLLATVAGADTTISYPRGDLRATTELLASRWVEPWIDELGVREVASHDAGLGAAAFPASAGEHRLRGRHHHVRSGAGVDTCADVAGDDAFRRGLTLIAGRRADVLTEFDGDLSDHDVPRLDEPVSPSRLESWVTCPHAYFAHYLLDVDPIEEPGDEISITARDRGSAHHSALDLFHRAVVDGALPQPTAAGWSSEHRRALSDAFDTVCERTERRGRTGRPAFWADERDRMRADLLEWLDHDSDYVRDRGATVLASEMRFGIDDEVAIALPDGRSIRLQGSVDRIDRAGDGSLVVTDHKTGAKRAFADLSADDPTAGGTRFQLPSYAAAARARFGTPDTEVQAEYGLLRKGDYARPGYRMTPAVDERVAVALAAVVDGIESGWFPNRPDRPGFRLFVSCEYCEPDHLGTAERWTEWERKRHDARLARWFGPEGGDDA